MTSRKLRQYLKISFIYLLFIYLFCFCLKFRENLLLVYKFVFATRSWGPKSFLHSRPHWSSLIDEKCNLLHIKLWIIIFVYAWAAKQRWREMMCSSLIVWWNRKEVMMSSRVSLFTFILSVRVRTSGLAWTEIQKAWRERRPLLCCLSLEIIAFSVSAENWTVGRGSRWLMVSWFTHRAQNTHTPSVKSISRRDCSLLWFYCCVITCACMPPPLPKALPKSPKT